MAAMTRRILIVDDNRMMRHVMLLHLREAGYEVEAAEDAIQAGHSVLKHPPDLIVCDVDMPHMTGFEFISALKQDRTLPNIPVIFLSANDDGHAAGMNAGAQLYLTKPVTKEKLLEAVALNLKKTK